MKVQKFLNGNPMINEKTKQPIIIEFDKANFDDVLERQNKSNKKQLKELEKIKNNPKSSYSEVFKAEQSLSIITFEVLQEEPIIVDKEEPAGKKGK